MVKKGPKKGYKQSKEHRARIGAALKGRKGRKLSATHRANISVAQKGGKHSTERKVKVSGESNGRYKDGLQKYLLARKHAAMMRRCYNLNARYYNLYGGIGITVAEPWHDRAPFILGISALLGECPFGYSLDRINPHGPYTEWNVRWADDKTQRANYRKNVADYYSQCGEH